jgi:hypothetical protein
VLRDDLVAAIQLRTGENEGDAHDRSRRIIVDIDPRWGALPDGARLTWTLPASPGALVPYPALTAALAGLGFVVSVRDGLVEARKTPVVVRGYRAGDEAAIAALFERSFHHRLSAEQWRWRYCDHPVAQRRVTVAVGAGGGLLGHYGGYPVEWRHEQERSLLSSHQNGDVMTATHARRLGHGPASVVSRMAQHFWAAYGQDRTDFHYGFNTGTAHDLQRRVVPGVRAVEVVQTWTRDTPSTQPMSAGAVVERVDAFGAEWDAFADRVARHYPLCSRRDARVLNWRYRQQPGTETIMVIARVRGRVAGGSVFRIRDGDTQWGDALFDRDERQAVSDTLAFVRALGVPPLVRAWCPPRPHWWAQSLEQLGFRPQPEPRGLTLVYAPFTDRAARLVPDLYYTWGDSDLF